MKWEKMRTAYYYLHLSQDFTRFSKINLLEQYTDPSQYEGRLNIAHPSMDPQLALARENPLKIRKVLDVWKIGRRFEYLIEQLDKPNPHQKHLGSCYQTSQTCTMKTLRVFTKGIQNFCIQQSI